MFHYKTFVRFPIKFTFFGHFNWASISTCSKFNSHAHRILRKVWSKSAGLFLTRNLLKKFDLMFFGNFEITSFLSDKNKW